MWRAPLGPGRGAATWAELIRDAEARPVFLAHAVAQQWVHGNATAAVAHLADAALDPMHAGSSAALGAAADAVRASRRLAGRGAEGAGVHRACGAGCLRTTG